MRWIGEPIPSGARRSGELVALQDVCVVSIPCLPVERELRDFPSLSTMRELEFGRRVNVRFSRKVGSESQRPVRQQIVYLYIFTLTDAMVRCLYGFALAD